jgi:flagellin-like hook-associated protein FlgL
VNNDGKDDILASSAADTLRSYTFSNGSFSAIGTISTPASGLPYDVSVGDVNHDGNIDVAVAGSDNVSIFLGDGSGGFTASSSYSMNSARSVELADFNGDGKLDFVTANLSSNQILVYLGNGLGQFSSHSTFTTAGGPIAMTAGDVNDDGLADIAVAYGTSNQVVVFENNGDAIFSAVQTFTEGSGASIENVDFVDLDEDGYLDLIYNVANQGVGIYYGNGAAQFVGRQSTTVNGFGELTEFKVLSGGSTFVPGSYVSVFNPAGSGFGFWFRVDGVGTQPFLPYINWGVDLSSGDSASSVASKLASAMATRISSDFEVTRDGTNIYVTSRAIGNTPDAITTAARISSSVTDGEADRSFSGIQISSISGLNSYAILDLDQDGDLDVVANNSVAKAWVYLQDSLTAPRSFSVQKPKEAGRLITTLDKAIERLKERQVSLDVLQSRLRISMDASLLLADTYEEARLSVASADLGVEVADLIVNQIRQQAAMAAQVQQNLSQKIILSLLL